MTDTDPLLARLAADRDAGFVDLVRGYQDVVYTVALRVSGQPQDAEDLTAETFLRAYRALLGYDADRVLGLRPRAWLLTIALNTWRNAVRAAGRRPGQVSLDAVAEPSGAGPSVPDVVEQHETRRELAAVLAELPHAQRAAVVLRHVVDLPIGEVAEVLGCPAGTAKSQVSRGLRRLRELCADRPEWRNG